mgnify:CR=1 FL=1
MGGDSKAAQAACVSRGCGGRVPHSPSQRCYERYCCTRSDRLGRLSGVYGISVNKNIALAEALARKFKVKRLVSADEGSARALKIALADTDIEVGFGNDAIDALAAEPVARVFNAISGCAGLHATLAAIRGKNTLALANKESLVSAGRLVMSAAREAGVTILPVDSEHCAVFECLQGESRKSLKRVILTASGGPFFGRSFDELERVTPAEALKNPNWSMGAKITVDSSTLMNKGFEIIEAAHLFSVDYDMIRVLVHRQSIIHSMVEYIDNTVKAQLSLPDMRHCAEYALTYPERSRGLLGELDLAAIGSLTFAEPDTEAFPMLTLARDVLTGAPGVGAAVNAANETAVYRFIRGEIGFCDIYRTVRSVLERMGGSLEGVDSLEAVYDTIASASAYAAEWKRANF